MAGKQAGYTVVEMLVVISVTALLAGILIIYSRTGEHQIILFRDQAKIINTILRAKSLAIGTYAEETPACGYGVHFVQNEQSQFILFKDLAEPCSDSDNDYSGEIENFEINELDAKLKFSNLEFTDILFIPPEPEVIIKKEGADIAANEAIIEIATLDQSSSKTIKVNKFGQVTTD